MIHSMKLLADPFNKIQSKSKIVEIRLQDPKRQKLKVGDQIKFTNLSNPTQTLSVTISNLLHFKSFTQMLNNIELSLLGHSSTSTKEEYLKSIYSIYTKEQEQKYGVVAIYIK